MIWLMLANFLKKCLNYYPTNHSLGYKYAFIEGVKKINIPIMEWISHVYTESIIPDLPRQDVGNIRLELTY